MLERDLLVAFIALGLGFCMVSAAVMNHERAFQIRTPNYLSQTYGRHMARLIIGCIGTLVALLGVYILAKPLLATADSSSSQVELIDQNTIKLR